VRAQLAGDTLSSEDGLPLYAINAAGDLMISATDHAGVTAKAALEAQGADGQVAAGLVAVRNDVRSSVLADSDSMYLMIGGQLEVAAASEGQITADLTGSVSSAEPDPEAPSNGRGVSFSGLVATNLMLGDVEAKIIDSTVFTDGGVSIDARNKADLTANPSLDDVLAVDAWSRQAVREAAARLHTKAPAALPA